MSRFARVGDVIINLDELIWVGIVQNPTRLDITPVSFHFKNLSSNFSLEYPTKESALESLKAMEKIFVFSPTPKNPVDVGTTINSLQ
jgi:hypothetical protein